MYFAQLKICVMKQNTFYEFIENLNHSLISCFIIAYSTRRILKKKRLLLSLRSVSFSPNVFPIPLPCPMPNRIFTSLFPILALNLINFLENYPAFFRNTYHTITSSSSRSIDIKLVPCLIIRIDFPLLCAHLLYIGSVVRVAHASMWVRRPAHSTLEYVSIWVRVTVQVYHYQHPNTRISGSTVIGVG